MLVRSYAAITFVDKPRDQQQMVTRGTEDPVADSRAVEFISQVCTYPSPGSPLSQ